VPAGSGELFATTRWTVVLAAGQRVTPEAGRALETLCRTYWMPLYAFARRQGHAPADAEDLTQGFFAEFLLKDFLTLDAEARPYLEVARALGMSEGAVKVAVHRIRRRYRELLRAEVAQTLARPEQVEEELAALMAAFVD
jgi:DNA-directed RNA polymerase specialized sigma24 family protein